MALPSRPKQVEWVLSVLNSDQYEDDDLDSMAKAIVDGFHGMMTRNIKDAAPPPHVGMPFNHPSISGVHYVAWIEGDIAWAVSDRSHFGLWVRLDHQFWDWIEYAPDRRRTTKKEKDSETGKERTVPIVLGPRPGEPGNNPDWTPGDRLSLGQRRAIYEVIATGDNCALLRDIQSGSLQADSNGNLEKYYRRESARIQVRAGDKASREAGFEF